MERSITFLKEVDPSRSKYKIVYIDIVHKCNMECANCYLPNRNYEDVDFQRLCKFLDQFVERTEFRLIGGEPTLHKDIFKIIQYISENPLRHRVGLVTNGLKLASKKFVNNLNKSGVKHVYISLNGFDDDEIYEKLDNMRCAKLKIKALKNLIDSKILINVGFIVVKGVNDHLLEKMRDYFLNNKIKLSFEFRNIGPIGRNMLEDQNIKNYSPEELKELIFKVFGLTNDNIVNDDGYSLFCKNKNFLIRLNYWSNITKGFSKETNFLRGRMTENFKVAPFLEHIVENEWQY